jgi:hypothetical protein
LLQVLNHSLPSDFNLITCKFDSMSDQYSLWGRKIEKYPTGAWHGYVCHMEGQRGTAEATYIDTTAIRGFRLIFIW